MQSLPLLQRYDAFLKASPFNHLVRGVGWELKRYGIPSNTNNLFPDLSDFDPDVLEAVPLDVLQAIADTVQVLGAGRVLYNLIEAVFRDRPRFATVDGLMTHAFGSENDVMLFDNEHLKHTLPTGVLRLGLNHLPFLVNGIFEGVAFNLEIAQTQSNLSEERWGELTQVPYHRARPEASAQPSDTFKLRLVYRLWNEAAQQGFGVPTRGHYSAPPWLTYPRYVAAPRNSTFNQLLKVVEVEYCNEREIWHKEDGSKSYFACTPAQFRAKYTNWTTIRAESPPPAMPSVQDVQDSLQATSSCSPDAYLHHLAVIWQFNNARRHPAEHHLWRHHDAEVRLAQEFLSQNT